MSASKVSKKICLVGDFGVGKTSLVRRFIDRSFSDQYLTTVGVKISRKLVEIEPQPLQLLIWDLEGSSKFKSISTTHLGGASAAIIVADLSRSETINHLEDHIHTFLAINPQGIIMIALNKADLVNDLNNNDLNNTEAIAQIQSLPILNNTPAILGTYPTSAKTGVYVDEIFTQLAIALTS